MTPTSDRLRNLYIALSGRDLDADWDGSMKSVGEAGFPRDRREAFGRAIMLECEVRS
jgi:hypothetical protein